MRNARLNFSLGIIFTLSYSADLEKYRYFQVIKFILLLASNQKPKTD